MLGPLKLAAPRRVASMSVARYVAWHRKISDETRFHISIDNINFSPFHWGFWRYSARYCPQKECHHAVLQHASSQRTWHQLEWHWIHIIIYLNYANKCNYAILHLAEKTYRCMHAVHFAFRWTDAIVLTWKHAFICCHAATTRLTST